MLLQLDGIHLLLLHDLLLLHFYLPDLHLSLQIHLINLLLIEALEVVWLHSVGSEHAHLRGRVLGHEVMSAGVGQLLFLQVLPRLVRDNVSILLISSKLLVNSKSGGFVALSLLVMVVLSLLEYVVVYKLLGIVGLFNFLDSLFFRRFFCYLLLTPILLL